MSVTLDEIHDIRDYLVDTIHLNRINNQNEWYEYYNDKFALPLIKNAKYIIRSGAAARLVDGVTEQIVSDNPQVFRLALKDTSISKERAGRVASVLNRWARRQLYQNINIYKEGFKNQLICGEVWYGVYPNENYDPDDANNEPVYFWSPDPTTVFFDPRKGEEDGMVHRLVICYERNLAGLSHMYPEFVPSGTDKPTTLFFQYWDDEVRYFEADDQALLREKKLDKKGKIIGEGDLSDGTGIQENVCHFVPFTHGYSGFGKAAPDGDPAALAVGRIAKIKDLFKEETTMRSDISYIVHKFAHKHWDIINKSGKSLPKGMLERMDFSPGIVQELMLPEGADIEVSKEIVPPREVFEHFDRIRADLAIEDPPSLRGIATGSSGRQEDIVQRSGLSLYDSVINNSAQAFAGVLGLGLRICDKLPDMLPRGLKDGDTEGNYRCHLELRADDPIERDRQSVQGRTLLSAGQISLRTNLIKYQGYTEEQADDEIDNILAEKYLFTSPDIAMLMQTRAAEKSGMTEDLDRVRAARQDLENQPEQVNLSPEGSQGGEPRRGNIKTEQGLQEADISMTQGGIRSTAR